MKENNKLKHLILNSSNKSFVFFSIDVLELKDSIQQVGNILNTKNIFLVSGKECKEEDISNFIDHHLTSSITEEVKILVIEDFELLSTKHQNRLLKIIEENESEDYFIFTTTNIKKIIPTIISRTIVYNFENKSIELKTNNFSELIFSKITNTPDGIKSMEGDENIMELLNLAIELTSSLKEHKNNEFCNKLIKNNEIENDLLFLNILIFTINEDRKNIEQIEKINKIIFKYKEDVYLNVNKKLLYSSLGIEVERLVDKNER